MEIDRIVLKKLWRGEKVICPNCGKNYLVPLHKKRKDNDDYQCLECKKVIRTISIFNDILNKDN